MVSSVTEETKEFIIHSNGEAGFVEITSNSNLCEVRKLIIEDFDIEQLPSQSKEFAFKVNGVRQSQKQEARKNAFELLEEQATVEIIPRVNNEKKRKIVEDLGSNENDKASDSVSGSKKRSKVDTSCAVTPFESSSSSSSSDNKKAAAATDNKVDCGNAAGDDDTCTTGTLNTSNSSSVGRPTNLDKNKFSTNDDGEKNTSDSDANELAVENDNDKTMGDDLVNDDMAEAQAIDSDDDDNDNDNDDDNDDDDDDSYASSSSEEDFLFYNTPVNVIVYMHYNEFTIDDNNDIIPYDDDNDQPIMAL